MKELKKKIKKVKDILTTETSISKSIEIDAPAKKVWEYLTVGEKKDIWSPWRIFERDATLEFEGTPGEKGYKEMWTGKIIGEGEQICDEAEEYSVVRNSLNFIKPFKSKNKTEFLLEENDGKTMVTWNMKGALPVFVFFLKGQVEQMVGFDFERGLLMLKELVETGMVTTSTEYKGKTMKESAYYISLENTQSMQGMKDSMQEEFMDLFNVVSERDIGTDRSFTIYHKVNLKRDSFHYSACIEISEDDFAQLEEEDLDPKYTIGKLEGDEYVCAIHKGAYEYLMNTWTGIYMYAKSDKIKVSKKRPSLEIYEKGPIHNCDCKDFITHVMVPVK